MFEGRYARRVLWSTLSMEVEDGDPCKSKDTRVIDVLETAEILENGHAGIMASSSA